LSRHPRLLFNSEGIAALEQRLATRDWLQTIWQKKLETLETVLKEGVELPERGGGWWHWYASPKTGATLKTGKQIGKWEWEHIDSVTDEVFLGDTSHPSTDYDLCVLMGVHDSWARKTRDLGLAYQITGEPQYAAKAREIMLAYTTAYPTYDLHTTRGEARIGGGKVGPQTLDEAVWLIPFAQGVDLIWDILSKADQQTVTENILQVSAREIILPHEMKVHNIQCWKNSAVGLVGFLLGDEELITQAIDHPERGYHKQMAEGVTPDGQWWEGAWGYHFYTLSALWPLVEAGRNCDIDLYGDALNRMFDGPLTFAMPHQHLPAFNDSHEVDLSGRASIYEIAQARYENAGYARLLGQTTRDDDFALWFGDEELEAGGVQTWESANLPESGYAVLARGKGIDATWLCFKYGPHGGGHGHPDKLNFVLYHKGNVVGVDPGTTRYGLPTQAGWYKTSLAHNVLVVDKTSQERAEGKCLAFGQAGNLDYCVADAGPIYEGVQHVRTVALVSAQTTVVLDQIACDNERLLDVTYHHRGQWTALPDGDTWTPPDLDAYHYLKDAQITTTSDATSLTLDSGIITLAGGDETQIITATGMGDNQEDRVPQVIFRRRTKETVFAWAISLDDSPISLECVDVSDQPRSTHAGICLTVGESATSFAIDISKTSDVFRIL
ncbi:MAG: alginate lyase family protein, partial [Rhodospirillaceae bacterium]|nr:alginate lyase family protein [Rhodospirillaceae bacterium]